jgi:hypothetical protein
LNHHKTIKEIYRNIRVCITKRDITLVAARVGTGAEPKLPEASIAREPLLYAPKENVFAVNLLTLLLIHLLSPPRY